MLGRLGMIPLTNPDSRVRENSEVVMKFTQIYIYIIIYIWKFPKMEVPPNHPFIDGFSRNSTLGSSTTETTPSFLGEKWKSFPQVLRGLSAGQISVWNVQLGKLGQNWVPSGKHTKSYWKWPMEIVDLPIFTH